MISQLFRCTRCLFVTFAVFSLTSYAFSDVIFLKNGKQITCDSAWEDGNQVRYKMANGIVALPKSMVVRIQKEESALKNTATTDPAKQSISQPGGNQTAKPELDAEGKAKLANSYADTGLSLLEKKDYATALDYFQKAHEVVKNETTAFYVGVVYFLQNDNWNAETYLSEVLSFNSKNADALNLLGEIAWRKEDLSSAESYWQRSLEAKDNPQVRRKLERLQKEQKAAGGFENTASRHFLIRYDGGEADPELVQEVTDHLEEAYKVFCNRFDIYPTDTMIVILYPKQQFYRATDAPEWSAGINDGKIRLPVRGVTRLNEELKNVLTHELAHTFIDLKSGGNCPMWLQEGLAQYSEGMTLDKDESDLLRKLLEAGKLPSISNLGGTFSGASYNVASVLYLESLSFLRYLTGHYDFSFMNDLLSELNEGKSYEDAIEDAYSTSLPELERQWHNELSETR